MYLISVHVLKCPHIRILDSRDFQPSDQESLDALDGPIFPIGSVNHILKFDSKWLNQN